MYFLVCISGLKLTPVCSPPIGCVVADTVTDGSTCLSSGSTAITTAYEGLETQPTVSCSRASNTD